MKTIFIKSIESVLKISGFLLVFLFAFEMQAQIDPEEKEPVTDTIKGYNSGKIEIQKIDFKYKYDAKNNWTEIIKLVDGKERYKRTREIEYY